MERERAGDRASHPPATLSVSGVIDYARCPKRFYWSVVRPLPRFSGPAARVGTQIHRWIEVRSRGQASLLDDDEAPDLTVEELAGEPGKMAQLRDAFLRSRFAAATPLFTERPFLLWLEDFAVAGRIDAIYGTTAGGWEIVDYKTGRRPEGEDPLTDLQLDLYALACMEVWGKAPEELTLTYLYLASGEEASHTPAAAADVRADVVDRLRAMARGAFEPTPGEQCRWCDFRSFCDAGKAFLALRGPDVDAPRANESAGAAR